MIINYLVLSGEYRQEYPYPSDARKDAIFHSKSNLTTVWKVTRKVGPDGYILEGFSRYETYNNGTRID